MHRIYLVKIESPFEGRNVTRTTLTSIFRVDMTFYQSELVMKSHRIVVSCIWVSIVLEHVLVLLGNVKVTYKFR